MKKIIMKCGCAAQGTIDGIEGCVVHGCTEEALEQPDLTGRKAECAYGGRIVDSNINLAFFEYRGPGSRYAEEACANCGYYKVAHTKEARERVPGGSICNEFKPRGPAKYDQYYCGCYGWD